MMKQFSLFSLLLLLGTALAAQTIKVWIDTDMVIGMHRKDVDDGLALLYTLSHDSVEIVGLSTVTFIDYTYPTAQQLLQWYAPDRNIPVYRGADTQEQLGEATEASKALANALKKQKLAVLVLGPSTNVATMLQHHPELADSIELLVMCQGRTPGTAFAPGRPGFKFADYNFELDPQATAELLTFNFPIVCSGYQASSNIFLNKSDIKSIFKNKHNAGNKWVYAQATQWRRIWKLYIKTGNQGFISFDIITVAAVLQPQWYQLNGQANFWIENGVDDTGKKLTTVIKPYLYAEDTDSFTGNSFIPSTDPKYKAYIIQQLKRIAGLKVAP